MTPSIAPPESPDVEVSGDTVVPFETSVLIASDEGFVLGASIWVADGTMFVATDERLPLEAEVDVSFVTPAGEETFRTSGRVAFWHDGDENAEVDRSGIGIALAD